MAKSQAPFPPGGCLKELGTSNLVEVEKWGQREANSGLRIGCVTLGGYFISVSLFFLHKKKNES